MEHQLFWNNYLGCYDALNNLDAYQSYLMELANATGCCPGMQILDAGSGTGNLSIIMKELGAEVVSLDFSKTGLKQHLQKDPEAKQVYASLEEELPLPTHMFDTVICASVLFSLSPKGIQSALSEFSRVLKPGGKLVLTVARHDISKIRMTYNHYLSRWKSLSLVSFFKEVLKSIAPTIKILHYNFKMHHQDSSKALFRRFTKEEFIETVTQHGYEVTKYGVTMGGGFQLLIATPNRS